jgi:glycosyltransferase involved in cell wall biosynthesis
VEAGVDTAEIIVVDDDSTDQTAAIAASLGARVLSQRPRKGPLAAWDRAAESTSADVLILVDGDCEVEAGAFPAMLAHFALSSDVGVVAARAVPLIGDRRAGLAERSARFSALVLNELKCRLVNHDFLPIGRLMAVRHVAWRVERTDWAPCDRAVAHWAKEAGWSIVYEPKALVHYEALQSYRGLRADFQRTSASRQLKFVSDPLSRALKASATLVAGTKSPMNAGAWTVCRLGLLLGRLLHGNRPDPSKKVYWDASPDSGNHGPCPPEPQLNEEPSVDGIASVALVSKYDPVGIGGIENHLKMLLADVGGGRLNWPSLIPITLLGGAETLSRAGRYRSFIGQLAQTNTDVVHFHGFDRLPLLVVLRVLPAQVPIVITPHNGVAGALSDSNPLRRWVKIAADELLFRAIVRRGGHIVALHDAERDYYLGRFPSCSALVTVLQNPVPAHSWAPLDGGRSPIRLLALARLSPAKRIQDLVAAMALLPQSVTCDIAGPDDGAEEELRAQASRVERTIRFHGPVYGEVKERLLQQASAVVVTSGAEGLPTVALEALAQGIPVIASEAAALGLPEQGVYRYRTGSSGDLVRVVQNLLDDDHLLDARRAARTASKTLMSPEQYALALLSLYQRSRNVLGARPVRSVTGPTAGNEPHTKGSVRPGTERHST